MLRKNTSGQVLCFCLVKAADGTALTGATVSVRRCIDGTFAAGGGTVTEDSGGLYKYALAQADTNGNDLAFYFTATSAIPVCLNALTTAADPTDGVRLGLTALPNAAAGASGGLPTGDASGRTNVGKWLDTAVSVNVAGVPRVDLVDVNGAAVGGTGIRFQKNTAFANFTFPMYATGTNTLLTGRTVTAQRRIDNGSFASCTNAASEVGSTGMYTIDLAAADLNGTMVTLLFTASGCDPYVEGVVLQG